MELRMSRELLESILAGPVMSAAFRTAQALSDELAPYPTPLELAAALGRTDNAMRERWIRWIIGELQAGHESELWNVFLLHRFYPALTRICSGSWAGERGDREGALWVAFLEVVHRYPLHRPSSVITGIVLDTRKAYLRALRDSGAHRWYGEHEELEAIEAVVIDDGARLDARVVLRACRLSAEDAELLWHTVVGGMTIEEYLAMRGRRCESLETREREACRLWRRRQRIRVELKRALCEGRMKKRHGG